MRTLPLQRSRCCEVHALHLLLMDALQGLAWTAAKRIAQLLDDTSREPGSSACHEPILTRMHQLRQSFYSRYPL